MNTPIGKLTQSVSTAFDPRQIPGCQLWLDAADTNTFTLSGTNISQWRDKSGQGNHANQATSSNQPTLSGNSVNYSTSNFLRGSFANPITGNTLGAFAVFNMNSSSFQYARVLSLSTSNNNDYISGAGGTNISRHISNNALWCEAFGGSGTVGPFNAAMNTRHIVSTLFSGTQHTAFLNGSLQGTVATSTNFSIYLFGLGFQAYQLVSATTDYFIGTMNEIIVYNSSLTTSQNQQVEGYLASKWGLLSSFPATHPFKSIPPMLRMFQPTDVSGCTLWLDAADNTTFTFSGANITQWNDKSGNANHAFNSTGTMLPTLGTNSVSLPAVDFNSAYLMNNNAFGLSNMSVFVVGEERVTNSSNVYSGVIVFKGITGGPNAGTTEDYSQTNAILIATPNSTETTTSLQVYSQLPPFPQLSSTGGNGYWTYRLYEVFIRTGTASEIFINGTSNASYTLKNRTGNSVGYLLSARQFNGTFTVGRLKHCEVLSYDRVLSSIERQQVESYLANKWALRGTLASTHPFKLYDVLSPAFTPVQISGCQLWLDASDPTTLTLSGSNISQWRDKSGNANNSTTAAGSPQYTTNAINGVSAVRTQTGKNFYFSPLATPANTTTVTAFAVATLNNVSSNSYGRLISFGNTANGTTNTDYNTTSNFIFCRESSNQQMSIYRNAISTANVTINVTYATPFIMGAVFDGTNCFPFMNGTSSTSFSSSGTFTFNQLGVGVNINTKSTPNDEYDGLIGEIIVYYTALTTSQRQTVEGYLAHKWGLINSLPASHPSKKFRP